MISLRSSFRFWIKDILVIIKLKHSLFKWQMSQQAIDAEKVVNRIREQVEKLEKVHSERQQVGMESL